MMNPGDEGSKETHKVAGPLLVVYLQVMSLPQYNHMSCRCNELGSIRWSHLVNEAKTNNYVST